MIKFTIPGDPKGKGRPRFLKNGFSYTPKDTVEYENWVKLCFVDAAQKKIEGNVPIGAIMHVYFGIPQSTSHKQRALMLDGLIRPTKKPDTDNIVKAIFDALNSIAYDDDKQIVSLTFEKRYGEPRTEVEFYEIEGEA